MKTLKETIEIEVTIQEEVLIEFNIKDGKGSAIRTSEDKSIKEVAREMGDKIVDWMISRSNPLNHC